MKKYLLPCAALAGIALLLPSANATTQIVIKSRAIPSGKSGSLPVGIVNTDTTKQTWGADMGLQFFDASGARLAAGTLTEKTPGAALVVPTQFPGSAADVAVTGTGFVVTGATQPDLYAGVVRGSNAAVTGTQAAGYTGNAIGVLQLTVPGTVANGTFTTYNIKLANTGGTATYSVLNDGTSTPASPNTRPNASVVLLDPANSNALSQDIPTLADFLSGASGKVPAHMVAVGNPGDVDNNGSFQVNDVAQAKRLAAGLSGISAAAKNYELIAADVAPTVDASNNTVFINVGQAGYPNYGATGMSYGDGNVSAADIAAIKRRAVSLDLNTFPKAE